MNFKTLPHRNIERIALCALCFYVVKKKCFTTQRLNFLKLFSLNFDKHSFWYKKILFLFILSFSSIVLGQEIPPILKFQPEDYHSENQNWAVTQNKEKFIYVANNEGLLEYNGARWKLYPSPNSTIIRSLLSDDHKIYSGAYMEFGFWKSNKNGLLEYTSLSEKIKDKLVEDENIWNIKKFDHWILFQSFHRLYFYNTKTQEINFLSDANNYYRIFEVNNVIYIFKKDGNLVELVNGKEKIIATIPKDFNVKLVLSIFKNEDGFLLLTRNEGFFQIKNNKVERWKTPFSGDLKKYQVFCGIRLKDQDFILGTISNGIIHLSKDGEIISRIDQPIGLGNNTVLSLFEDADGNVWSALDNGINCLNMQSFIREYNDDNGDFGTTYCSIKYKDKIYIGTNQGLFYKEVNKNSTLKKVSGINGQVWSLFIADEDLLCGHTSGTFQIKEDKVFPISTFSGTWNFREINNNSKQLLQGHYSGLSVLEKNNNTWSLSHKVQGFNNSARFFEILDHTIWVNHEYKGVYKLASTDSFKTFNKVELLAEVEKGKGSGLALYDNNLLYSYQKGIFKLDKNVQEFQKDSIYSQLFTEKEFVSGKLITDNRNRLWSFNKSTISYLEKAPIEGRVSVKFIPIQNYLRKTTVSFENISNISKNKYLVGKTNGYLLLDLDKKQELSHTIYWNEIHIKNSEIRNVAPQKTGNFKDDENSITFKFSTPVYNKYEFVNYQYKLNTNDWVDLGNTAELSFENLSYGDYTIAIRSTIGNEVSENTLVYEFKIKPPYFLTTTAFVIYVLVFLLLGFFVHRLYNKYYRKQHQEIMKENLRQLEIQKIQADKEVIRLKNEKLSQEIEGKNRELAISTMSIIKRNEFLRSIKKELKNNPEIEDENPVFKLIEKNLNSTKDWDFFREAFNNADKDFLKRAKKLHPDLTHNNLKFCAYLRLNLSSKEIAPLLNISVKSVEIRRYRLRKKLNLPHETNLTDYILSI